MARDASTFAAASTTHWNYRVVRREDEYEIREIYYNGERIAGFCQREPGGATLDELREDLQHMLAALDKPVLEVEDLHAQ